MLLQNWLRVLKSLWYFADVLISICDLFFMILNQTGTWRSRVCLFRERFLFLFAKLSVMGWGRTQNRRFQVIILFFISLPWSPSTFRSRSQSFALFFSFDSFFKLIELYIIFTFLYLCSTFESLFSSCLLTPACFSSYKPVFLCYESNYLTILFIV